MPPQTKNNGLVKPLCLRLALVSIMVTSQLIKLNIGRGTLSELSGGWAGLYMQLRELEELKVIVFKIPGP